MKTALPPPFIANRSEIASLSLLRSDKVRGAYLLKVAYSCGAERQSEIQAEMERTVLETGWTLTPLRAGLLARGSDYAALLETNPDSSRGTTAKAQQSLIESAA